MSPELAEQMGGWAGLRNVLVHLYLDVDTEQLYKALTNELSQLEAFAKAVSDAANL